MIEQQKREVFFTFITFSCVDFSLITIIVVVVSKWNVSSTIFITQPLNFGKLISFLRTLLFWVLIKGGWKSELVD